MIEHIIYPDGEESWFKDGKWHRIDGPAKIDPNGLEVWYKDGKYYREDGPAFIWSEGEELLRFKDGSKFIENQI